MGIFESLRKNCFMPMFEKDPQRALPFFCESTVAKRVFLSVYKTLPPIEGFPDEEKREWKKFVHELFPGKDVQFKLDAVKIIYAVGTLTN